jgi:hypothetical protein
MRPPMYCFLLSLLKFHLKNWEEVPLHVP